MIQTKRPIAGTLVGSGEDWLTKLSTAKLKDLLILRQEALAERAFTHAPTQGGVLLKKADPPFASSILARAVQRL